MGFFIFQVKFRKNIFDKMKQISNEGIQEIISLINNRQTIQAKKKLTELEDSEGNKILDDLKRVVRNLGKSNMIMKSEIEEIINRYSK